MTLRVRLLLGLVVLAAIGLAVAGGITYRQTQAVPPQPRRTSSSRPRRSRRTLFFSRVRRSADDDDPERAAAARHVGRAARRRRPARCSARIPASSTSTSPTCPRRSARARRFTVQLAALPRPRRRAADRSARPAGTPLVQAYARSSRFRSPTSTTRCTSCCIVELVVALGVLLALGDPRVVGRSSSGCGRSSTCRRPPARSPPATSPGGSRSSTSTPRSAGSGSR